MKSLLFSSAIGIVFVGQPIHAQTAPAPSECLGFATAIEEAEKDLSMLTVEGFVESSAPREAVRQQKMGNDLQLVSLNLSLAGQAHCPGRKQPIAQTAYFLSAAECEKASADVALLVARGNPAPPQQIPACDRRNWKRDLERK